MIPSGGLQPFQLILIVFCRQRITVYDSLGFLGLYLLYIIVVVVGRILNTRWKTQNSRSTDIEFLKTFLAKNQVFLWVKFSLLFLAYSSDGLPERLREM